MKRVEIVSQDKFNYQRDALEPPRARSFTEAGFPPPSPSITEVPPTALSPSAEVFRPRANTAPTEPLSRSLPTGVPESPNKELTRHGSRTPKRKDVKVAPRFFPAFSKENVSDQVSLFHNSIWIKADKVILTAGQSVHLVLGSCGAPVGPLSWQVNIKGPSKLLG